jgi:hypothetical protein
MEGRVQQETMQTESVRTHQPSTANSNGTAEKYYSVQELARKWFLSDSTVRRIFLEEPGVLKLAHKETRYKRRYTTLRIPERIAQRVHRRLQGLS